MPFVVVYDACVLWSAPLRDLLVRLAIAGLVQAKWTEAILDETFRTLLLKRPDLSPESFARTRELMNRAVRDCVVSGHDALIPALELPDPDDRHVLAAAIHSGAQVVVTFNTADFPDRFANGRGPPRDARGVRPHAVHGPRSRTARRRVIGQPSAALMPGSTPMPP